MIVFQQYVTWKAVKNTVMWFLVCLVAVCDLVSKRNVIILLIVADLKSNSVVTNSVPVGPKIM